MKALYCITNGYAGESYVRAYAWADSEEEARALAESAFRDEQARGQYPDDYATELYVDRIFAATAASFVSAVSSDGFDISGA